MWVRVVNIVYMCVSTYIKDHLLEPRGLQSGERGWQDNSAVMKYYYNSVANG